MKKTISSKIVALTFGVLVVSFLAAFYVVAWQEPTQAPPEGNVPTPLNVSDVGQIKTGNLVVNALGVSAASGNALVINSGGNLCLGTDCRDKWPETGVVTTYKMEASSYKVYNSELGYDEYFSKTVSYECPVGSSIVNISCTQNMVNLGGLPCTNDPCEYWEGNSCSCSGNNNAAILKAYIYQGRESESCPGGCGPWSLVDYCYPHSTGQYGYRTFYDCYITPPLCAMEFQCGIQQTVGE